MLVHICDYENNKNCRSKLNWFIKKKIKMPANNEKRKLFECYFLLLSLCVSLSRTYTYLLLLIKTNYCD